MVKKIILVRPQGLCAGVERALKILDLAVSSNPGPIFCKHEIVHNQKVVDEFKNRGVKFIEDLELVPNGSLIVLSAHGTSPQTYQRAKEKKLKVIDAVCPLVTKVHNEAKSFSEKGYLVVYLGHKGHPEGIGVMGEAKRARLISNLDEAKKLKLTGKTVLLTQTTLSLDEARGIVNYLRKKWPKLELPIGSDICFSTTNRQIAVKELAKKSDLILVVGSKTSSNSNRLREVAGKEAYLVDGPEDLKEAWFKNKTVVGITAGASVPEKFIKPVVEAVKQRFGGDIEELEVIKEKIQFKL